MNSIERRAKQMLAMHGPDTEREVMLRIDAAQRYSNRLEADFWWRILEARKQPRALLAGSLPQLPRPVPGALVRRGSDISLIESGTLSPCHHIAREYYGVSSICFWNRAGQLMHRRTPVLCQ